MAEDLLLESSSRSAFYNTMEVIGNVTNPLDDLFLEPAWKYMTTNYSRFTISFWISVLVHEVCYSVQDA